MKVSFIALFKSMKRKNDPGFLVRVDVTAYNLNHLFFFDVVSAPTIAVLVTIFPVRLSRGVYSERIPPWKAPKEVGSGWKKGLVGSQEKRSPVVCFRIHTGQKTRFVRI